MYTIYLFAYYFDITDKKRNPLQFKYIHIGKDSMQKRIK